MFEMNIAMNKVKMKYLKEAITIGTFFFLFFLCYKPMAKVYIIV